MRFAVLFLGITAALSAQTLPFWVSSYGERTPYSAQTYLTGFAQVSRNEDQSLELAKDRALADLAKKIRVRVQSELVQEQADVGGRYKSSVASVTRTTVDASLTGVEIVTHRDGSNIYALSYVPRKSLLDRYARDAADIWRSVTGLIVEADDLLTQNRVDEALRSLLDGAGLFSGLYKSWSLYRAVNVGGGHAGFFIGMDGAGSIATVEKREVELNGRIDELMDREASTLDEALGLVAEILARQKLSAGRLEVPPFQYGTTAFSSEFGRYAAIRLESRLTGRLSTGTQRVIVQGRYWEEGDKVRLITSARSVGGKQLAGAEIIFPRNQSAGRDLKPQNFDEAMKALLEFAEGSLTEGGINVDIWTNKGREEDGLVFSDGEELQIYMRVNQPAFLQLTYQLATGDLVLLEPSFFIGIQDVNRVVKLPYVFEVQSPLGAEQFVATAYSTEPPKVSTVKRTIGGEVYDVFLSMKDVVSATRGLKKKKSSEVRVGEARFSLTTLPSSK